MCYVQNYTIGPGLLLLRLKQDTLIQTLQARRFLRHQLSLRLSVRRLELSLL